MLRTTHPADSCKAGDDLAYALKYGTTLVPRLFLSFAALFHGAALLISGPGWWRAAEYAFVFKIVPELHWGLAFLLAGLLGCWRLISPRSRPVYAYIVNAYVLGVWNATLIARLFVGWDSLLSTYTAFSALAFWCLIRTEATPRDTRTA